MSIVAIIDNVYHTSSGIRQRSEPVRESQLNRNAAEAVTYPSSILFGSSVSCWHCPLAHSEQRMEDLKAPDAVVSRDQGTAPGSAMWGMHLRDKWKKSALMLIRLLPRVFKETDS